MQFSSVFFVFRVQKSQLITLYIYCTTKRQSDWRFECNDADLSPKKLRRKKHNKREKKSRDSLQIEIRQYSENENNFHCI